MSPERRYDLIVIGAGPAGQKAAIQGAKAGKRVLVVEREQTAGGECVHRGTIPSKTLRENAVYLAGLRQRSEGLFRFELGSDTKLRTLMRRLDSVLDAHKAFISEQLARNDVELLHGRARFLSPTELEVLCIGGERARCRADIVVITSGSRPRSPSEIDIDHEQILDSDSILSLSYLPQSLLVVGAGVIACEFATIFQALGVRVTIVDRGPRPMPFLDPELSQRLVSRFESSGGRYIPEAELWSCVALPGGGVRTKLVGEGEILTDKALVALGRTASLSGLGLDEIGVETTARGHLAVDERLCTSVPNIFGAGDVIGPPALAATAMEQGRRAVRHALGLDVSRSTELLPMGIYTIPEIAGVGEPSATDQERPEPVIIGRANFDEIARGQINGEVDGVLKLVSDARGERILGAHILGEGATELVHVAQVAMIGELSIDSLIENTFNFPTMAEAYRVAALDIVKQRARRSEAA